MKLPKTIQAELDACGLPWRVRNGSKHRKLYVGGVMAGVIPHNLRGCRQGNGEILHKCRLNIRRAAKKLKGTTNEDA